MKSLVSTTLVLLLIASIALWSVVYAFTLPEQPTTTEPFVVENANSRVSIAEVGTFLKQNGYIRSVLALRFVRMIQGAPQTITAGSYDLRNFSSLFELSRRFNDPTGVWIKLSPNMSKIEIAKTFGEELGWTGQEQAQFVLTLSSIQWDAYNDEAIGIVSGHLNWGETEQKTFSTISSFFSEPSYDIFATAYEPGSYLILHTMSQAQMAQKLVERSEQAMQNERTEYLAKKLTEHQETLDRVSELVRGEVELLPDLVLVPPTDIFYESREGKDSLVFTTTYWNQGLGSLELVGDPNKRGIAEDHSRDVFQRIYRIDGEYRDRLTGNFEWHQEHLHYHFEDFVDYELRRLNESGEVLDEILTQQEKTTYCIRDVNSVNVSVDGALPQPTYRVCGKERQGISVGWGDSYYYTYPDQLLDISELPSGRYELSFNVNPRDRFDEITLENNFAAVVVDINKEARVVSVVE